MPSFHCLGITTIPKRLGEPATMPDGLIEQYWDFTADGKPDAVTYAHDDTSLPLFYVIDEDKDNAPDSIYIDPKSEGQCSEIVLYKDMLSPTGASQEKSDETRGSRI